MARSLDHAASWTGSMGNSIRAIAADMHVD
jgi:hypothetical protein